MRCIFIATGDIALPSFRHLVENGPRPLAVVTQPDKPVGRHQILTAPAIKLEALAAGIPVFQPERIGEITSELAAMHPEVLIVMAYGQILRKNILTLASHAIINLHASLLPKYRGAACIQAAIDAGDAQTGITVMHVVKQLDAGDIIVARSIPISPDETGGALHDRLADLAPLALADALVLLSRADAPRVPQNEAESSYIPKLERDDGKIDWSMPAEEIERRIRAYDPWPGTFAMVMEGGVARRLKIFPPAEVVNHALTIGAVESVEGHMVIGCGKGAILLNSVQPEGSRRMSAADYLRGREVKQFES